MIFRKTNIPFPGDIQAFQIETLKSGLSIFVHTWAILLWYRAWPSKKTEHHDDQTAFWVPMFSGQNPNHILCGKCRL